MGEFDRVHGTDPALDRAQKRIQEAQSRGNPSVQEGADIEFEVTSGTPRTVSHRLGRKPQGFVVTSQRGAGAATLRSSDMGAKGITFELDVPTGSDPVTKSYKVRVY